MEQLELVHESLEEAISATVAALGGKKVVASILWPEKQLEEGARYLADCLNPERGAHLSPAKLTLLLKLARAKGIHTAMAWILADVGYAPPQPVEPADEDAELLRQECQLMERLEALMKRRERLRIKAVG